MPGYVLVFPPHEKLVRRYHVYDWDNESHRVKEEADVPPAQRMRKDLLDCVLDVEMVDRSQIDRRTVAPPLDQLDCEAFVSLYGRFTGTTSEKSSPGTTDARQWLEGTGTGHKFKIFDVAWLEEFESQQPRSTWLFSDGRGFEIV
jgi:hypothetical protein